MQDLWYIGKAIGLQGFGDEMDSELDRMNSDIARAKREDRKKMKSTDDAEIQKQLGGIMEGTAQTQRPGLQAQNASARWVQNIRDKYRGSVIRRTVNSLGHDGEAISGLDPYEEHMCVVEMYDHEYEALEALAEDSMDSETFVKRVASEVSCFSRIGGEQANQVTDDVRCRISI